MTPMRRRTAVGVVPCNEDSVAAASHRQCLRCEARASVFSLAFVFNQVTTGIIAPHLAVPYSWSLRDKGRPCLSPTPTSLCRLLPPRVGIQSRTARIQYTYVRLLACIRHHRILHPTNRHSSSSLFSLLRFLYLLALSIYFSQFFPFFFSIPFCFFRLSAYIYSGLSLIFCLSFYLSSPPSRASFGSVLLYILFFPYCYASLIFFLLTRFCSRRML